MEETNPVGCQEDFGEQAEVLSTGQADCTEPETSDEVTHGCQEADSNEKAHEPSEVESGVTTSEGEAVEGREQSEGTFDFGSRFAAIEEKIDVLSESFQTRIARSDYEDRMLKQYSDEIQQYRSDLYKKITLPLVKELIELRDMMSSSIKREYEKDPDCTSVSINLIETYRDMIESSLSGYGVEPCSPEIGDELTPGVTRTVGKVKTGDESLHGRLAAVMNDGYLMDGKCISPAKVKVFTFDKELSNEPLDVDAASPSVVDQQPAPQQPATNGSMLEGAVEAGNQEGAYEDNLRMSEVPVYNPED